MFEKRFNKKMTIYFIKITLEIQNRKKINIH